MPTIEKDKRHFKRYRKQSDLKLIIEGKAFKAKAVDYSFNGVGAILEGSAPHITKGSVVDVEMNSPQLRTRGEVVWTKKSESGLVIGIKMLFSRKGRLEDFPLADILIGFQRSEKTGVLEIKSSSIIKKVYIRNGDMIFATSNKDEDRLGEILLRSGKINLEQFNHSKEVLEKTGKKHGTVLVELGYLKPNELIWAVKHQVEEIILSLFNLDGSNFEFIDGPHPSGEIITLKLSAANLIYRGIKRMTNPQKVFDLMQLPQDTILCLSPDPLNLFQDIALDVTDTKILFYLDGRTPMKDIISLSPLKDFETLRTLYAFLSTRIVEVKKDEEVPVGPSAQEIIEEAEVPLDEEFVDRVEKISSTYERLGYYSILGVKEWASSSDIKRAYYKAAKEFHPDRHFRLKSDVMKEKLNEIFSYITAAYSTLSDNQKRNEYDKSLSNKPSAVVDNQEIARTKFEEGKREFRKGNYSEAFQLFGQAVYLDNMVADYHYYYGVTLAKQQRFKEAERAIERALEYSSSNPDYLTELGYILFELGFQHRAKSSFEKAIKIDPSHQRAIEGIKKIPE